MFFVKCFESFAIFEKRRGENYNFKTFFNMSDDILKRIARSGGCRLCLAPDSECVPIFATAAADKEPLSNKILSCIGIKVSQLNLFHFVFPGTIFG